MPALFVKHARCKNVPHRISRSDQNPCGGGGRVRLKLAEVRIAVLDETSQQIPCCPLLIHNPEQLLGFAIVYE